MVADPEQIYAEVQQEEQQKGSSPAVIEARAKAARLRATEGSPHPKEPKWWPGAQPQFDGDGAAPEGEAPPEEPAPEEPAAEEPVEQPAAESAATAEQPAAPPAAPAEQPAAQAPAAQPAAAPPAEAPARSPAAQAPAPAAATGPTVTEAPERVETLGVSHGTPAGNRLRPEDSVASDAQFEAQEALYRRRQLIDDLVSSGVPAVSATETERRGSGFLALLYLIVPLIAVVLLLGGDTGSSGEESAAPEGGGASAASGDVQVVAENLAFDVDTLELAAGEPQTIGFENQDTAPHNIAIYEDADAGTAQEGALFDGEDLPGGSGVTYEVDPLDSGEYYFQCDIHPSMQGDVIAEGPGGGGSGGGGAKGGGGGNG